MEPTASSYTASAGDASVEPIVDWDSFNFLYAGEHTRYKWGRTEPGSWPIVNVSI